MRFEVLVTPGVGRATVRYLSEGLLQVRLKSRPVGGRANDELLEVLADYWHVRKRDVELVIGKTSREKLVDIMDPKVIVDDLMQSGYEYVLAEPAGENFAEDFAPELSPKEMLALGVFGGRYMRDCRDEFPDDWFEDAVLYPEGQPGHDAQLNYFHIDASQSLDEWRRKGWIHPQDPRGWFQWYCRYYMGRRSEDDERQIKRWKAIRRHEGAVRKNCRARDMGCRPKQRQALLHWAYDSRKI